MRKTFSIMLDYEETRREQKLLAFGLLKKPVIFQGYVSCGWGVDKVGFVIVTYGICDAIGSFSLGYVIKRTGRVPIFMFGAILNIIVIVILFLWHPDPDKAYIFFILAGLWGIADSVWQTQINGEMNYV